MAYAFPGKVDLAYKTAREAVSIAEESGDIFSKTIAYSFCGCNGEKRTRGFAMEQAIARIILD
jgi:hypothetical protein